MDFDVVQGDIAQQSADVLVNAAGTSLEMGTGVAGAPGRGAGEDSNEAAVEQGPVDLGAVAVTDALDLDAEWVLHAAAMPHHGDRRTTPVSIRDATRNALERADELGAQSLVVSALGCGVGGFDLRDGARIVCEAIDEYEPATLSELRFVAYDDEEFETVRSVADEARGER